MGVIRIDCAKIARLAGADRGDIVAPFPILKGYVRHILDDDPQLFNFVHNLISAQEMPDALMEELVRFVGLLRNGTISIRDWLNAIEVEEAEDGD